MSEVGARMIDEWLRQSRFPEIEFRTILGERVACLKGRLEVWQLIMVAKDFGMDVERVALHLSLRPEQVRAGIHYYEAHSEEIERSLTENALGFERLKQLLPQMERTSLTEEELRIAIP